ncbi:hypothetical protein LC612_42915 [Nostoc sp. CHAB 5834]|nr:hypothetical protein [Nostoc sp. CHAB 5834]
MLKALDVTVAFRASLLAEVEAQRLSHPKDDLSYEEAENLLIQLSVPTVDEGTPQQCAEALFLQFIEARDMLRGAGFQRPSHNALMRMTR